MTEKIVTLGEKRQETMFVKGKELLLKALSFLYAKKVNVTGMNKVEKYKILGFTFFRKAQDDAFVRTAYFKLFRFTRPIQENEFYREFSSMDFDMADLPLQQDRQPLVSVIVPNYNHAPYLEERLKSIYRQTYRNMEVILLDDASSDRSVEILERYAARYAHNTRLVVNEENSGKVFRQWNKGLRLAKGELVWIAESDDWCDANFLEEVVAAFVHQSVMLSFAHSVFMQEGKKIWTLEDYLSDLPVSFKSPFVMSAHSIVNEAFAIKNVVPNVSSAVFRNVGTIPDEITSLWGEMSLCGDWLFYLWLIRGGAVSYTNRTHNYYRIHSGSTSLKIQKTLDYYIETYKVSDYVARHYAVDASVFEKVERNLLRHCKRQGSVSPDEVKRAYDVSALRKSMERRTLNVVVCGYGMMQGGGEIFPIYLANELKRQGLGVTFIDFRGGKYDAGIRKKLHPAIPLVELNNVRYLKKALSLLGADIVHTHEGSTDKAVARIVKNTRQAYKHIITLHGMYEAISKEYLNEILENVLYSCSCFVYIADKNLIPFKGVDKPLRLSKIGNGLPMIPVRRHSRAELGIGEHDFCITLASRSLFEKGWLEAIEAVKMANARSERPIHLVLVGDGECYDQLKGKKLPSYIHLLGRKADVRNYFAMSDLGLLPSRFKGESFPLVVIESFMSGVPVVASDIGEIRNMVTAEDGKMAGVLFELADWEIPVEKLAQILLHLSVDGAAYQNLKTAVGSVLPKFDIAFTARQYIHVYQSALKGDRC